MVTAAGGEKAGKRRRSAASRRRCRGSSGLQPWRRRCQRFPGVHRPLLRLPASGAALPMSAAAWAGGRRAPARPPTTAELCVPAAEPAGSAAGRAADHAPTMCAPGRATHPAALSAASHAGSRGRGRRGAPLGAGRRAACSAAMSDPGCSELQEHRTAAGHRPKVMQCIHQLNRRAARRPP